MAKVFGQLRKDATPGEVLVLDRLKTNLPNDVSVFVETPIISPRKRSDPDFIILTNYGFVILEIKDWSNIEKADPHCAIVKTRHGVKKFYNPISQAREYALDLTNAIKKLSIKQNQSPEKVPYGYAVVLPFIPAYEKASIEQVWGESFVLFQEDLNNYKIKQSLRNTIRGDKIKAINKGAMDLVRGAIYPEIASSGVILDEEQTKLVLEPSTEETGKPSAQASPQKPRQVTQALFDSLKPDEPENELPLEGAKLISSNSVRLVRGVMGSGKTLVLLGKAKHWSKTHPDWKILVLSFNKQLAQSLKKELRGYANVRVNHLDQLLREIITAENSYLWVYPIETEGWVSNHKDSFEIIQKLGDGFVSGELRWIQEVMIGSREEYLDVKRVGRGNHIQISKSQRNEIYDLLQEQYRKMAKNRQMSWESLYVNFLKWVENGVITPPQFDAILIDEAQDFAPSWIAVVNKLLKPKGNLFMVDDPTQSIFRYFSWRQRGVDIIGRTRYLKLPYRNSKEIYLAARSIVQGDEVLVNQLKSEGEEFLTQDDLSEMRTGEKPLLITMDQPGQDVVFVESQMLQLKSKQGIDYDQMCVIVPKTQDVKRFSKSLSKYRVKVFTINQPKGLTYEVVFFCGLEQLFRDGSGDDFAYVSNQRRIIHSCMGRAKRFLYLLHNKKLSNHFEVLRDYVDFYTM